MVVTTASLRQYRERICARCGWSQGGELMVLDPQGRAVHEVCSYDPPSDREAVILGADVLDTTGEAPVLGGASLAALEWNAAHGHPSLLVDGSRPAVVAHETIGATRRAPRQVDTKFMRATQARSGIKPVSGGPVGEVAMSADRYGWGGGRKRRN